MASETRIDRALRPVTHKEWYEAALSLNSCSVLDIATRVLDNRRVAFDPPPTLQQKISNKMYELEGESYETIAAQIAALIEKERTDGK